MKSYNLRHPTPVAIGTKAWCEQCAALHERMAAKFAAKYDIPDRLGYSWAELAMYHLFMSYLWRDTKPWN